MGTTEDRFNGRKAPSRSVRQRFTSRSTIPKPVAPAAAGSMLKTQYGSAFTRIDLRPTNRGKTERLAEEFLSFPRSGLPRHYRHFLFIDIEIGEDVLDVIVFFKRLHKLQHLLCGRTR